MMEKSDFLGRRSTFGVGVTRRYDAITTRPGLQISIAAWLVGSRVHYWSKSDILSFNYFILANSTEIRYSHYNDSPWYIYENLLTLPIISTVLEEEATQRHYYKGVRFQLLHGSWVPGFIFGQSWTY